MKVKNTFLEDLSSLNVYGVGEGKCKNGDSRKKWSPSRLGILWRIFIIQRLLTPALDDSRDDRWYHPWVVKL